MTPEEVLAARAMTRAMVAGLLRSQMTSDERQTMDGLCRRILKGVLEGPLDIDGALRVFASLQCERARLNGRVRINRNLTDDDGNSVMKAAALVDLGLERALVATVVVHPERFEEVQDLSATAFDQKQYADCWRAIQGLSREGIAPDALQVVRRAKLDHEFMAHLLEESVPGANLQHWAKTLRRLAWRRDVGRLSEHASNGCADARLKELLEGLAEGPGQDGLLAGALVSMADVVARMPVYVAGSVVRETGLHLWWAQPGHLKTYLAIWLVLEMTQRRAGDLLFGIAGLEITRPWRKVVWLGDEESEGEWKARAEAVARGHGLRPPGDEIRFADATGGASLLNLDDAERLLDLAGEGVDAFFADPLANLVPDTDADGHPVKVDLDNPHALKRTCRPLRRLCKLRGIAAFLLHHANSTGQRERGPTAYRGSADVLAQLEYEGDVLTLADCKNRDRAKGRFSFRPVWEQLGGEWSVRFEPTDEPEKSVLRSLHGTARAMYSVVESGAGRLTYSELMETKFPAPDKSDVSSRTKRRAWKELEAASLACVDKGVIRLVSPLEQPRTSDGHEMDKAE